MIERKETGLRPVLVAVAWEIAYRNRGPRQHDYDRRDLLDVMLSGPTCEAPDFFSASVAWQVLRRHFDGMFRAREWRKSQEDASRAHVERMQQEAAARAQQRAQQQKNAGPWRYFEDASYGTGFADELAQLMRGFKQSAWQKSTDWGAAHARRQSPHVDHEWIPNPYMTGHFYCHKCSRPHDEKTIGTHCHGAQQAPPPQPQPLHELSRAYATLGLQQGATRDEVISAHRKLIIANHPDRGGDVAKCATINAARDRILKG